MTRLRAAACSFVVVLAADAGCGRGTPPVPPPWLDPGEAAALTVQQALDHYRQADPAADVSAALAHGDRRYVGVMGQSETYPGLPDDWWLDPRIPVHGAWTFPHVTDGYNGQAERELHAVAHEYARRYNAHLLARLQADPNLPRNRPHAGSDATPGPAR